MSVVAGAIEDAAAPVADATTAAVAWGWSRPPVPRAPAPGERVLRALDDLRRWGVHASFRLLRPFTRTPALRGLLVRRDARSVLLLTAHALGAFTIALLAPSLSLVVAPLVLGVPHVASDVRHLVVRRALPRWWVRAIVAFAAALIATRLLEEAHVLATAPLRFEHGLASAWLVVGVVGGARLGGWRRSAWPAMVLVAAVVAFSLGQPRWFRLVFVQAHNLVAIAIWLLLLRRGQRLVWLPVAVVLLGAALLGSGILLGVTVRHGALSVLGLHLFAAADWIAPGLPDGPALALTTAFAFLQAVHYAIWLVAIPRADARTPGRPTVRMAWRNLARDLTAGGVACVAALALVVLVAGVVTPMRTRALLLSMATFHAWLELALLAFFVARDGLSRPAPARARA